MLPLLAGLVATLISAAPAWSHLGKISYSNLGVDGSDITYRLKFAAHLVPGIEANRAGVVARSAVEEARDDLEHWLERGIRIHSGGQPCPGSVTAVIGPDRNDDLQVISSYACPAPITSLRVQFTAFRDAGVAEFENIAAIDLGGKSWSYVFGVDNDLLILGDEPRVAVARAKERAPGKNAPTPAIATSDSGPKSGNATTTDSPGPNGSGATELEARTSSATTRPTGANASSRDAATSSWQIGGVFLRLGVEHILEGYDHLLFLLALLAVGGTVRRLVSIVTAFTIAHSITLGLATLGWISLPSRPVEIVIAASIAYVAIENLARVRADHRPLLTFGFGLIHGFGFAGVLRETGLPPSGVFVPLLGFNLGVELGQLLVVAIAVPLLRLAGRNGRERGVTTAVSVVALTAALYWLIERIL